MRNYFSLSAFVTVILTVGALILGLFLFSLIGNVNLSLGQNTERTFTVEGQGKVEVTPDTYTSTFTVQEQGDTQEQAQQAGNTKQNEALQALRDLGFAEEDIKTTQYSINPRYDFPSPERGREEAGFDFFQSTSIETKERATMEQALDRLAAIGINIGGINIEADEEEYMQEARKNAMEDAREKAEELAKAGGFRVGKIVTVSEASFGQPPIEFREAALPGTGAADQSVISPGTDEVTATVSVTYYIN